MLIYYRICCDNSITMLAKSFLVFYLDDPPNAPGLGIPPDGCENPPPVAPDPAPLSGFTPPTPPLEGPVGLLLNGESAAPPNPDILLIVRLLNTLRID